VVGVTWPDNFDRAGITAIHGWFTLHELIHIQNELTDTLVMGSINHTIPPEEHRPHYIEFVEDDTSDAFMVGLTMQYPHIERGKDYGRPHYQQPMSEQYFSP